jgi:uncharacterized protein YdeI (YjbR/CyaY-like superfamily)
VRFVPVPTFFASPARFRQWLKANHLRATEVWVGYHKKETGKQGLDWSQSVDEALCFGWIDGIRKSLDATTYTNRFTPRKRSSNWSAVNIAKMERLLEAGRVAPAGRKAYEQRDERRSEVYSFERKATALSEAELATFRKKAKAWKFWEAQPPGYRRTAAHWVTSAKRPETRAKRFATLIADSAAGLRIGMLRR